MKGVSFDALLNPRRRLLLDLVRQDAGVNFRELARRSNLAPAVTRHHLSVLVSNGLVVERRHGCTLRFFDCGLDEGWVEAVLRREPGLAELHDWLKSNPRASQQAVIAALRSRGWSRSTTQHRLARLVSGGAVTVFLQGRYKLYSAAPSGLQPAPFDSTRQNKTTTLGRSRARGAEACHEASETSIRLRSSNSTPTTCRVIPGIE